VLCSWTVATATTGFSRGVCRLGRAFPCWPRLPMTPPRAAIGCNAVYSHQGSAKGCRVGVSRAIATHALLNLSIVLVNVMDGWAGSARSSVASIES
jgi:hypothetical protein